MVAVALMGGAVEAAAESDPQGPIRELADAKDRAAAWASMTPAEQQVVRDEITEGEVTISICDVASPGAAKPRAFAGCWSRAGEATWRGACLVCR